MPIRAPPYHRRSELLTVCCRWCANDVVHASTKQPKHELLVDIHNVAAQIGVSVSCHDSNHEGEILDWLLESEPTTAIILCWNGNDEYGGQQCNLRKSHRTHLSLDLLMCVYRAAPLSESPMVRRALEQLDQNQVIVVSPLGIEHGPLPASVCGVLTGTAMYMFAIAHCLLPMRNPSHTHAQCGKSCQGCRRKVWRSLFMRPRRSKKAHSRSSVHAE